MTEADLVAFLKANLTLQVTNTPDPWDYHDHIVIDLCLQGETISEIVIDIGDGDS